MPTSKKPRRRHNPRRMQVTNKPTMTSVFMLFDPIYTAFDKLAAGEIESVRGRPVFKDWEGNWCEVAPAMQGWADCWDRICQRQGMRMDMEPLRKMSRKLSYDSPLTEAEVAAGRAAIDQTREAFRSLPVEVTKDAALTEQIAIQLETNGLKQAA